MKNKKIIILIVIIILVIIVGGISVFAYSKTNKKEEEKELTFADIMKEYKAKGYVPFYITIEEKNIENGIKIGNSIDLYYSCNSFSDEMKNNPLANNLVFGNNFHEESSSIGLVAPQYIYEYIKYTTYLDPGFIKKENCNFTVKKSKSKKDDEIKLNKETQKWLDERNMSVSDVE